MSPDYVSSNGAASHAETQRRLRLVVVSYILAVAMPPLGLILGIVVATRPAKATAKHGIWIILISLVAALVWALIIAAGGLTATDGSY